MTALDIATLLTDRPAPGGAASPVAALQAAACEAAGLLRTLANPERLILMCTLAGGERCVSDLAQDTGIQQPTLSQQLGVLRDEGLVSTRRAGKFIYYRVASERALQVLFVLQRLYCTPAPAADSPLSPSSPDFTFDKEHA